jgi:hypothetical protein
MYGIILGLNYELFCKQGMSQPHQEKHRYFSFFNQDWQKDK